MHLKPDSAHTPIGAEAHHDRPNDRHQIALDRIEELRREAANARLAATVARDNRTTRNPRTRRTLARARRAIGRRIIAAGESLLAEPTTPAPDHP